MTPNNLFCFAHRGGRGHGTENSLATIEHSLNAGVEGIEIDVWEVAGKLLVTHDRTLGRTIKGSGRLLELTAEQVFDLRHYDDSVVASLQQVLDLVGNRAVLNVEIKGPDCVEAVANLLKNHCQKTGIAPTQYLISSFDHQQLYWLLQHAPEFRRGVLVSSIPLDFAACCDPLKAYSFHPSLDFVNRQLIADARKRGLEVVVYTVNDEQDFKDLAAMGVTGVFSDFPDRVALFNKSGN